MLNANYTSENICRALGLGGFANDWQLAKAEECIRVLLAPAFHREICISVCRTAHVVSVSVVTALSQIWLQDWPVPQLVQVASGRHLPTTATGQEQVLKPVSIVLNRPQ